MYIGKLETNRKLFNIKGTSKQNLNKIENDFNIKFPESLYEFLLLAGEEYDDIFDGIGACKLSRFKYNIELAQKLLAERNLDFKKKYIPFASYSGDQFMFVYLDEGDDPTVYQFETELFYCGVDYMPESSSWGYPRGVSKIADSFSDMINRIVECKIKENSPK